MSAGEHRKFEVTVQVSCHQGTKTPRETFEKRPLLSPAIGGMSDSNFARSEALALSSKYSMYSSG